jgi:hypothetical protein
MWQGKWLCALVAMYCNSPPDIAGIQTAYETKRPPVAHSTTRACRSCKPNERSYFDIVSVARAGGGWELKSGLCKP